MASKAARAFQVVWNEDGDATALGRLTARNGSGAATGVDGEGNFAQQGDLTSITFEVFELDDDGVFQSQGAAEAVTIASSILDTPVTTNVLWTVDTTGYNFIHDIPAAKFPTGGKIYKIEYNFTFSGGAAAKARYVGPARGVEGS